MNPLHCRIHSRQINKSFRAHPLNRLCEHEGAGIPKESKSDCYQDVDETEFACKEKYRIMVSRPASAAVIENWLWSLLNSINFHLHYATFTLSNLMV